MKRGEARNDIILYLESLLYIDASDLKTGDLRPSVGFPIINSIFIENVDRRDIVCKISTTVSQVYSAVLQRLADGNHTLTLIENSRVSIQECEITNLRSIYRLEANDVYTAREQFDISTGS
jgi:hypothetical protein